MNFLLMTDWYDTITIDVYKQVKYGLTTAEDDKTHLMRIHGRLQNGKLHGLVVMIGIFSNDPQSLCSASRFQGTSFIGHFVNGHPAGTCWKGLIGGSWIVGEVDDEGEFTGKIDILYLFRFEIITSCIDRPHG
jgi:hypothetical protein